MPLTILMAAMVVAPILLMIGYTFFTNVAPGHDTTTLTTANWAEVIDDTYYLAGLWKTIWVSCIVALVSAVIGYPPAFFVARLNSRYKSLLLFAFLVPFWISYIIRTFSWVSILGDDGIINKVLLQLGWTHEPVKLLYTEFGVFVGLLHFVLPYMIVNLYVVLESIDENVISAARSLGANSCEAFLRVTLPLSAPGLLVGLFLSFTLTAGGYVTPAILGGPRDFLFGNLIYDVIMTESNWPLGSVLSMLLLGLLAAVSMACTRYMGINSFYKGLAR
jgi:spermidine/putrescine transport system permease protein